MIPAAPAWHRDAACATHPDPDLWFRTGPADQAHAAAICSTCPVSRQCELDGIGIGHGIWGGRPARSR